MINRFTITETEKERILGLHEQLANPFAAKGNGLSNSTLTNSKGPSLTVPNTKLTSTTTGNADIVRVLDAMKITTPANAAVIDSVIAILNKPETPSISKYASYGAEEILKVLTPLFPDPKVLEFVKSAIATAIPALKFPVTSAPVVGVSQPIKLGVTNDKVKQLQTLLNTKYQSGLVPDGKWGPKTAAAIKKVLDTKKGVTTPIVSEPPKIAPPIDSSLAGVPK
jgi:hypothetical protein